MYGWRRHRCDGCSQVGRRRRRRRRYALGRPRDCLLEGRDDVGGAEMTVVTVASIILVESGAFATILVSNSRVALFVVRVRDDEMRLFRSFPSAVGCFLSCLPPRTFQFPLAILVRYCQDVGRGCCFLYRRTLGCRYEQRPWGLSQLAVSMLVDEPYAIIGSARIPPRASLAIRRLYRRSYSSNDRI